VNPTSSPKKGGGLRIVGRIVILLLLVVVGTAAVVFFGLRSPTVVKVAETATIPFKSWTEQAEGKLNQMMEGKSAQGLASHVQAITHPTGKSPKLSSFSIRRVGEQLSVRFDVTWKGGVSASDYTTRVVWELDKDHHIRATVTDDNAPFAPDAASKQKLDEYFRTECYPVLVSNLGK